MKIKYFLRGLGAGMLLATIILFAVYSYRTSDARVAERAREMGMVYKSDKETEQTTSEEQTTPEQQTTSDEKVSEKETSQETTSGEQASEERTSAAETESTAGETISHETGGNESGDTVKVSVPSGTKAASLALMLEQLGVVSSGEEFKNYLIEKNYTHRLKAGEFYLRPGMSYEEIIGVLVR